MLVESARLSEEEPVTRHRPVCACACQNKSVVTAEGRDHYGYGHDERAEARKDYVRSGGCDAVARRCLNLFERQRRQVCDVREKIERDDEPRAERERERN